jgi:hypothetical protein
MDGILPGLLPELGNAFPILSDPQADGSFAVAAGYVEQTFVVDRGYGMILPGVLVRMLPQDRALLRGEGDDGCLSHGYDHALLPVVDQER